MNEERYGEIHIERLPAMHVACCRAVGPAPEEAASEHMDHWRSRHHLPPQCRHFGFDTEVPPEAEQAGMRGYEVWTTVPDPVVGNEEVTVTDVPGGSYAVMTITDPFDDPWALIPAGWERLHAWVETNPWVSSGDRQWLEELVEHDGHRDLVLLHPVR